MLTLLYRAATAIKAACQALPFAMSGDYERLKARIDIHAVCLAVAQRSQAWLDRGESAAEPAEGAESPPAAVAVPEEVVEARERSNTANQKATAAMAVQEAAEEALSAAQEAGDDEAIAEAEMELLEAQAAVADAEEEATEAAEELEELAPPSGPRTLVVPTYYDTIADALAEAEDGDTVEIEPGQYQETLTIEKVELHVVVASPMLGVWQCIEVKGTKRIGVMITVTGTTAISCHASGEVKLSNLTIQVLLLVATAALIMLLPGEQCCQQPQCCLCTLWLCERDGLCVLGGILWHACALVPVTHSITFALV